jgi:hypothetical protein
VPRERRRTLAQILLQCGSIEEHFTPPEIRDRELLRPRGPELCASSHNLADLLVQTGSAGMIELPEPSESSRLPANATDSMRSTERWRLRMILRIQWTRVHGACDQRHRAAAIMAGTP